MLAEAAVATMTKGRPDVGVPVNVTVAPAPLASDPREAFRVPPLVVTAPLLLLAARIDNPVGMAVVKTAFVARSGPRLVTVAVKVKLLPR